jgi:enamine deaminase RidA (YjgF/YER057c/UK114 family)
MRSSLLAVSLLLSVAAPVAASAEGVERQIVVPPQWQGAYDFGYAPAIRVGDWVIVSGVPAGGEGTYEEKIRRMYERVGDLLAASGANFADVVELTSYHLESKDSAAFREEFEIYMPIHREFFGEHRPAWSAVGTSALLSPSAVVELRVVAVAGSAAASRVVPKVE